MISIPFSASADNEADAKLNVSFCVSDENVVVSAFFGDIKVKDGIISVEYDIQYDHTTLELVNIKHIIPEKWNNLIAEENVENFSMQRADGVYRWGYAVIALGEGAKIDKELGFVAEFRQINNKNSDILITYSDLRGEVIENGKTLEFVHMASNSAKVTLDPSNKYNSKLFYADVDPKTDLRKNRFYEVDNITESFLPISEENPDDGIGVYLSLACVFVCLIVFLLCSVYIFTKTKRG